MLIEVNGVNFANKGAELMLHAVLQKVRCALPDTSLAMAPSGGHDYEKRARLGLYQKVRLQKGGISLGWMVPLRRRQRYRRLYGIVLDEDVDVVLDASGFMYSDQWGEGPSVAMASSVKAWKKRGTKVILLPQAMGPFTSRAIREAFVFIVQNADLVFPRDSVSCKHVVDLVGERDNVQQSPDFTVLVSGITPDNPARYQGRFCLIPNCRMMDKTSEKESNLYPSFCASCIRYLTESGNKPFILIHEGVDDQRLAERIVRESREEIEIVTETDPLRIKGILGLCAGVVGSRFHGLVSALSQGVPALASGWSHKYKMLFEEYGIPEGCLPVTTEPETLQTRLAWIANGDTRRELSARIAEVAATYRRQTEMMWQRVLAVIANR